MIEEGRQYRLQRRGLSAPADAPAQNRRDRLQSAFRKPFGDIARFWKSPRVRIVFWAAITGILFGISEVALPVEDILINARTSLRLHPSDGQIVVVLQDQRTLEEMKFADTTHADDARLVDNLIKAGGRRVYFDRTLSHAVSDETNGDVFGRVARKYPGSVFLGALPSGEGEGGNYAGTIPVSAARANAGVVSLLALTHPFNLSMSMPLASGSPLGTLPSLSASIAGVTGTTDDLFRPDYSIDHRTVPTLSYVDVIKNRFDPRIVDGKVIIIGMGAGIYHDLHTMPAQGYVPGVYFHAIAAETLKHGMPIKFGWIPAFLLVLVVVVSGVGRGRSLDFTRFAGLVGVLIAIPFALDIFRVQIDIVPAIAMATVAVLRMRNLDRVEVACETNAGSGLPSVQVLRKDEGHSNQILVALKIRNYAAIIGSFAGHVEGQIAHEVLRRIRISDDDVTVYHEGGIFLWLSTIRNTFDLCENLEGLHRIVQNNIQVGGMDIDLSFNCGIDAEFERPLSSRVAGAMQSAEEAVRQDELVYAHDSQAHEAQWEISLLTQLDRAIDNGEVWVAYQPKLDLRSNRITGVEALVRWTHPERGPISPEKFIRIAEEFHRIDRITRFVVNEAVRSGVALYRRGLDMSVSVNISAQLLRNSGLAGMISEILTLHGLPPERLILEITETDRLDRSSRTVQMLQKLVDFGVRLSIDDFGTGNATIDYLRCLPATEVKIDKVFVQAMEASKEDLLLVQSIIEMAHSQDRVVVAEGVETLAALDTLRSLNCDMIQGYYVSRPVPFRDILAGISAREPRLVS